MKLSRAAAYAIHACCYIAQAGRPVSAGEIAAELRFPASYTVKVLHSLKENGILKSVFGPGGGFTLCGSYRSVTLLEIIELADAHSVGNNRGTIDGLQDIPVAWFALTQASGMVRQQLASISLADLVKEGS